MEDENGQARTYQIVLGYNARGNVIETGQIGWGVAWQYGYVSSTSDALKWFKDQAGNQWTAFYIYQRRRVRRVWNTSGDG